MFFSKLCNIARSVCFLPFVPSCSRGQKINKNKQTSILLLSSFNMIFCLYYCSRYIVCMLYFFFYVKLTIYRIVVINHVIILNRSRSTKRCMIFEGKNTFSITIKYEISINPFVKRFNKISPLFQSNTLIFNQTSRQLILINYCICD